MRFSRSLAALLLSAAAAGAAAEEAALSYVVTAGRTAEETESVPALVTVVTAEQIAASGAANLTQVLESIPGVRFSPSLSGTGSESISMRGFGENSFGRVLVLVDGVRLNNPDMRGVNWNAVALSDVERIEVLDGSASVQYGNSAVGGVVNIITKKDRGAAGSTVAASVGSYGETSLRFSHRGSESWGSFSIAAEHGGSDGYRDRQSSRTANLALQGSVDIWDTLVLSGQVSLADSAYQLPGSLSEVQFKEDPTQAAGWVDEGAERRYSGNLSLVWYPAEGLEVELPLSIAQKFLLVDMGLYANYQDHAVVTGEARPKATLQTALAGMPLRIVAGVDLYGAEMKTGLFGDKAHSVKVDKYAVDAYSVGAYGTVRLDLLRNLTANLGVRQDAAFIEAENKDATVDDGKTHSALVYEAGVSYRPFPGLKVYGKYATLFRYPFTDEQVEFSHYDESFTLDPIFNTDLEPETGFNLEGGLGVTFDDRISLDGNFYLMMLEDEIAYTTRNVNMDATRRIGANISVTARPADFLDLKVGYAWVDATFAKGDDTGNRVPLVSSHSVDASAVATLGGGLSLGPTVSYRSSFFGGGDTANALDEVDGYAVYGAMARYVLERSGGRRLALQLSAKNLLDLSYTPNVYWGYYYPADGRSISLSAEYRY